MNKRFSINLRVQPVGKRIMKTCLAVTLCLLFYMVRGYAGEKMPAEAAITAIICMSTNIRATRSSAAGRFFGTLIGAFWGFLFLVVIPGVPALGKNLWALYLHMGLGTLLALYTAVLIRKPEVAGLSAIVFLCVVISYPDIENPMEQAFKRILDVMVGTTIAILVNTIRLPRKRRRDRVFFVRMKDLALDQFAEIPTTVLYRLENLLQDGAKICLMSEHAPAFHTTRLGNLQFSVPMIVMDGAAIYDANENAYLSITSIDQNSCRWLMKRLDGMGRSYFIYTVHRDRNCIFHHGQMTGAESAVYQRVKRSPYRYYLDDDHFPVADVVYLKIVGDRKELEQIESQLRPSFDRMKLRSVIREQAGLIDGYSLYLYSAQATIKHAEEKLMRLLWSTKPDLAMQELTAESGYRSEYDAVRLTRKLAREYEPLLPVWWYSQIRTRIAVRKDAKTEKRLTVLSRTEETEEEKRAA